MLLYHAFPGNVRNQSNYSQHHNCHNCFYALFSHSFFHFSLHFTTNSGITNSHKNQCISSIMLHNCLGEVMLQGTVPWLVDHQKAFILLPNWHFNRCKPLSKHNIYAMSSQSKNCSGYYMIKKLKFTSCFGWQMYIKP